MNKAAEKKCGEVRALLHERGVKNLHFMKHVLRGVRSRIEKPHLFLEREKDVDAYVEHMYDWSYRTCRGAL